MQVCNLVLISMLAIGGRIVSEFVVVHLYEIIECASLSWMLNWANAVSWCSAVLDVVPRRRLVASLHKMSAVSELFVCLIMIQHAFLWHQ